MQRLCGQRKHSQYGGQKAAKAGAERLMGTLGKVGLGKKAGARPPRALETMARDSLDTFSLYAAVL